MTLKIATVTNKNLKQNREDVGQLPEYEIGRRKSKEEQIPKQAP